MSGCAPSRVGLGLIGYDHTEGEGFLRTQKADLQISGKSAGKFARWTGKKLAGKKFIVSTGLGLGVGQKSLDWSKLTFTDQYGVYEGFLNQPSAIDGASERSNVIFDMSAGIRMQASIGRKGSYISFGGAMFHMNRPVETFFNVDSRLQPRYTLHAFTYFQTKKFANKPSYLAVGMITDKQQGLLTNTIMATKDVGSHAKVGLGFRRQNFLMVDRNVDALILQGLMGFGNFTLGYSYDITISSLGPQRTFGTHEIGLTYTFGGFTLCSAKSSGRNRKKSADDCFMLMSDINSNFKRPLPMESLAAQ
ncbi:MAG: type IX secretion system membrane protein PorP/SprF [Owenweeksia sp.]|nr:type IX secretion system membrane protein PorP/SprF [Owenweeksia sp.]